VFCTAGKVNIRCPYKIIYFYYLCLSTNFINVNIMYSKIEFVLFILGDSVASGFYVPTFRNTLSGPSSYVVETRRITETVLLGY
jgi:hypothetical protein